MKRAMVVLVVLVVLAAACGTRSDPRGDPTPTSTETAGIGGFARPPALEGEPCGLEATSEAVWILTCSGTLLRIPKDGGAVQANHLDGEVLALDGLRKGPGGRLWALVSVERDGDREGAVVDIDAASGEPARRIDVGGGVPMSATAAGQAGWIAMLDGRLLAIAGGTVEEKDRGAPLVWADAGASGLWTVDERGDASLRDPETGAERSRFEGVVPEAIASAAVGGALWAASPSAVVLVDPSGEVRVLNGTGTVNAIEACGEGVWLSHPDLGLRSLTEDGVESAVVELDVAPRYLACDGARMWVLSEDGLLGSIDAA